MTWFGRSRRHWQCVTSKPRFLTRNLGSASRDTRCSRPYRVTEPLERLAEKRNDNLGSDLAKYIGQVTIGSVPMKWVPMLENTDVSDPIYGINWQVLKPFVKKGVNMMRHPVKRAAHQRNVREVHYGQRHELDVRQSTSLLCWFALTLDIASSR